MKRILAIILTLSLAVAILPFAVGAEFVTKPMIAAGGEYTLALRYDGTVWAWGANNQNQLGVFVAGNRRATPMQIPGLSEITAIAAGEVHSLALKNDGTVWVWGRNKGQLGLGDSFGRDTPTQIPGFSNIVAISSTYNHSMVLKSDGTVWEWGYDSMPEQVTVLTDIVSIAAGFGHSLALKKDGTVWAWGSNLYGQLGIGNTTNSNAPVQTVGLGDVISIAAGGRNSLAVKTDGTVWAWGNNVDGYFGSIVFPFYITTPRQMAELNDVVSVSLYSGILALKRDGTVWAWGRNSQGELGLGDLNKRTEPTQIPGLSDASLIIAGPRHSLIMKSNGTVWACGNNYHGQLGLGDENDRFTPTQVQGPGGEGFLNLLHDRIPGDANGNGEVITLDALQILRYLFLPAPEKPVIHLSNSDVNEDGNVDMIDVLMILQYCAGGIPELL